MSSESSSPGTLTEGSWLDSLPPLRPDRRRAGVLLDRDGTIIADTGYVTSVDRVAFIPGAIDAIAALNRAGIPVAVVTNQSAVARGYCSLDDVVSVHEHIAGVLADHGAHVDCFFFCPYHPDGSVDVFRRPSEDRKPRPGMAIAAAEALHLDLRRSWVVGDRPEDLGLAASVGARSVYLGGPAPTTHPSCSAPDLARAVALILERMTDDDH